jgi:hypothetical protein
MSKPCSSKSTLLIAGPRDGFNTYKRSRHQIDTVLLIHALQNTNLPGCNPPALLKYVMNKNECVFGFDGTDWMALYIGPQYNEGTETNIYLKLQYYYTGDPPADKNKALRIIQITKTTPPELVGKVPCVVNSKGACVSASDPQVKASAKKISNPIINQVVVPRQAWTGPSVTSTITSEQFNKLLEKKEAIIDWMLQNMDHNDILECFGLQEAIRATNTLSTNTASTNVAENLLPSTETIGQGSMSKVQNILKGYGDNEYIPGSALPELHEAGLTNIRALNNGTRSKFVVMDVQSSTGDIKPKALMKKDILALFNPQKTVSTNVASASNYPAENIASTSNYPTENLSLADLTINESPDEESMLELDILKGYKDTQLIPGTMKSSLEPYIRSGITLSVDGKWLKSSATGNKLLRKKEIKGLLSTISQERSNTNNPDFESMLASLTSDALIPGNLLPALEQAGLTGIKLSGNRRFVVTSTGSKLLKKEDIMKLARDQQLAFGKKVKPVKKLSKYMVARLKQHSKKQSKKHINKMRLLLKKGYSFKKAHTLAKTKR